MSSTDPSVSRLIRSLKGSIDELIVQLNLGRAEAADQIERGKELLREKIDLAIKALPGGGASSGIRGKLEHLRLQLALGRMETREALEHQRDAIHRAIDEAREDFHDLDEDARHQLGEASERLQTKLNALALDFGIAALVAEDEAKVRKDEILREAARLAERLKTAAAETSEAADPVLAEARRAYDDLKDNLKRLAQAAKG